MSPTNHSAPADDVLACVRRLVREAAPAVPGGEGGAAGSEAPGRAGGRLVLTPAHRVDEAAAQAEARPAPVLVLSEVLRAAPPPEALREGEPADAGAAPGAALPLDEAALRRLVAEAVREALGGQAIRDLVRREVLLMLDGRED